MRITRITHGIGVCWAAAILLSLSTLGCGESYKTGEVNGTLVINGKPGHKVRIEFVPDAGVPGPPSTAETDSEGKFVLKLMEKEGSSRAGALVGAHRVVLCDLQLSESATGRGIPIRFSTDYTLPSSTPLRQEVTEGEQTVIIEIP